MDRFSKISEPTEEVLSYNNSRQVVRYIEGDAIRAIDPKTGDANWCCKCVVDAETGKTIPNPFNNPPDDSWLSFGPC